MKRKVLFTTLLILVVMSCAAMAFAFSTTVDFSGVVGSNNITIPNSYTLNGITISYDNLGDPTAAAFVNNQGITGTTQGSLIFNFSSASGLSFNFAQIGATQPITGALYIDFQIGGSSIGDGLFNTLANGTGFMTFTNGIAFDRTQMFFSTDTANFSVNTITYEPLSVTTAALTGTVNLMDFGGNVTAVPLTVELNGTTYNLNLAANGKFTIPDVPVGTYNVRIKASHWLAKMTAGVNVNADTDIGTVNLINGDVVNNNEVDFSDINAARAAYGSFPGDATWNELADVDGSGEVDFTDINIVRSKYGEIGN